MFNLAKQQQKYLTACSDRYLMRGEYAVGPKGDTATRGRDRTGWRVIALPLVCTSDVLPRLFRKNKRTCKRLDEEINSLKEQLCAIA